MALIVPLTLPEYAASVGGVHTIIPAATYAQAYARVICARAHSDKTYILVSWYADEDARLANADPVKVHEFAVRTRALTGNFMPAVYEHLKTLPEFVGASDHPLVDPAETLVPVEPEPEPAPEPTIMEPVGGPPRVVEPEPVIEPTQPEAQA